MEKIKSKVEADEGQFNEQSVADGLNADSGVE
jgi:hypothetical protein